MAQTILTLHEILVRYGAHTALHVSSLNVVANTMLAIMGPNGAGKSTLLRVMGLLQRPRDGTVLYRNENPYTRGLLSIRRRIGTVFQEPLLLNATVYENAALGLKLRRFRKGEIDQRLKPWLERLGIEHLSGRPAHTLSGGEAQRTSLARALALEPEILLLDEPFSRLDPPSRESLQHDFQRIAKEISITTVLVTHDRDEAFTLGDQIGVLKDGKLLQLGSREGVFLHPETNAVAEIIGIENRLAGVVENREDDCSVIAINGGRVYARTHCRIGTKVVLCVRAEDIALTPTDHQGDNRNRFKGKISGVVSGRTQHHLELDCHAFRLKVALDHQSAAARVPQKGDEWAAMISPEAIHVIGAETTD